MKAARILVAVCCLVAVAPFSVGEVFAHRGWVGVGVGNTWGSWWGPWGHPSPWYAPVVVVPSEPAPMIYIEKNEPSSGAFWYYCRDPSGYYPYVSECREGWLRVLPQKEN
ncbi:hypothetical protein [Azonexus sp.]|jgi:hypothetical protein|uniref:hypothetical protein n=1 Tax=Azonexus sp. TaxID=1872668 RepID=UPI0028225AF0|nr:hypothetical protein [Azonexus sp.]MDR1995716.1 hypothetical protein [Azonexus sp.]